MLKRAAALAVIGALLMSACGGSDDSSGDTATTAAAETTAAGGAATTAAGGSATTAAGGAAGDSAADLKATAGEGCGLNNGKKASGKPIVTGNVTTSIPGIDFSTGTAMMEAYFKCVNDNGGINGRPIEMKMENDNGTPEDAAAAARKLIETDKVVAMVGGFSILDCPVNNKYYAEKGYNVIVAGVPAECFSSPAIAAVNAGPAYSAEGAAVKMIEKGAKGKIVSSLPRTPTADYGNSLAGIYIKQKGLQWEDVQIDVPISDPTSVARDLVNRAGKGGGVLLNYTPPEGLKILKAAEEQNLIDQVVWGSSTPLNDTSVAVALGSKWKGKININAEFSLLDDPRPEMELYRTVSKKYNPDAPLGSFQQMGFVIGRIVVHTLLQMDPKDLDDPVKVNAAIKGIKMFASDHLCRPWYFGGIPTGNVPNSWDYNVVPGDGKMVDDSGCFEIPAVDPILTASRKAEIEQKLTTAKPNN